MKKIIRLTESDLARIVKRVIKEQETSQLMPVKYTSLKLNGDDITTTINKQQAMFVVTPSYGIVTNSGGTKTTNTNILILSVNVENIANSLGRVMIDCRIPNKVGKAYGASNVTANNPEWCMNVPNRSPGCGEGAAKVMRAMFGTNSTTPMTWKYEGVIKDMGDKYCKAA